MNEPDLMATWAKQVTETALAHGFSIEKANLIEIGAGHSLGVAAALLVRGAAEVTAIDIKAYADPSDLNQFLPIIERCQEIGLLDRTKTVDLEKIEQCLKYSIVKDDGHWNLDNDSADLVYSYFSGEHWRSVDQVLAEIQRVLKPGGLCLHAIDLRDHYHFEGNWLQFLYYEPWLWEAMTSKRGKWSNRLLSPQWYGKFEKLFEILSFEETRQPVPPDFDSTKLAAPFQKYDLETLLVSHLWVVARKPSLTS